MAAWLASRLWIEKALLTTPGWFNRGAAGVSDVDKMAGDSVAALHIEFLECKISARFGKPEISPATASPRGKNQCAVKSILRAVSF
jgi:hypothetical protein